MLKDAGSASLPGLTGVILFTPIESAKGIVDSFMSR